MQDIPEYYPYGEVEKNLSAIWVSEGRYKSIPNAHKPYVLTIPPPNVTGVLHLGHTLNVTVQDILARWARMQGLNVCWIPGSDHASIATEVKVLEMLKKEKDLDKKKLSRENFLVHAHVWKKKYGGMIYEQFKRLGCSLDWDRLTFTLDDDYYKAVMRAFVKLYDEGYIYKGKRMIHWDIVAQTALSDEEVEYREESSTLYHVRYYLKSNSQEYILVATQRPETIMGDVAICVHPDDERYKKYHGQEVCVPIVNRYVPVITDERVQQDFGTGVLKITPAHALEDYEIAQEHSLPSIATFELSGKVHERAKFAVGKTILSAKELVIKALREKQLLDKEEMYSTRIGYSQRTNVRVEPFVSTQWFVKMKKFATRAQETFDKGDVCFFPQGRFNSAFSHWMTNVKDWCISRQLWWGHRIPVWHDANNEHMIVAEDESAAYDKYIQKLGITEPKESLQQRQVLHQEEDCLDTWFSSWLWPIQLFRGITNSGNSEISYYYPTTVVVTGHDILFFWVARMMMAGEYFMGKPPFSHVYFTGMVRDKLGRKMSKSLGNSPDLNKMIENYGADVVRFAVMIASPAGNDLLFNEQSLEQGRNFINKLWNVWKLLSAWSDSLDGGQEAMPHETFTILWLRELVAYTKKKLKQDVDQYRLNEAMKKTYTLIWSQFCNTGLEWIKPPKGRKMNQKQYEDLLDVYRDLLRLLHPFMPFVTEDLYIRSYTNRQEKFLPVDHPIEDVDAFDERGKVREEGVFYAETISHFRELKQRYHIGSQTAWKIHMTGERKPVLETLLCKILGCEKIIYASQISTEVVLTPYQGNKMGISFEGIEVYKSNQVIQIKKDLSYQEGLLLSIQKKLSSEQFMNNASADVIARERKKEQDTKNRIFVLLESVQQLGGISPSLQK